MEKMGSDCGDSGTEFSQLLILFTHSCTFVLVLCATREWSGESGAKGRLLWQDTSIVVFWSPIAEVFGCKWNQCHTSTMRFPSDECTLLFFMLQEASKTVTFGQWCNFGLHLPPLNCCSQCQLHRPALLQANSSCIKGAARQMSSDSRQCVGSIVHSKALTFIVPAELGRIILLGHQMWLPGAATRLLA